MEEYIEKHQLKAVMEDALLSCVSEKPEDPYEMFAAFFWAVKMKRDKLTEMGLPEEEIRSKMGEPLDLEEGEEGEEGSAEEGETAGEEGHQDSSDSELELV